MAQARPKAKSAEKKSVTRRSMPWSIKGVSPEAREAARKAVDSADMTMGEWLGEAIRAVAAEERGAADRPEPVPASPEMTPDMLEPLAERIAAAERRTALMVAPLHELLETIARRLEGLEGRLPVPPANAPMSPMAGSQTAPDADSAPVTPPAGRS